MRVDPAALAAAAVLLEERGAPLTSAGRGGPAVPAGVRGLARTLPPDPQFNGDAGVTHGGSRDVLLTLAGAVVLQPGQRVALGEGPDVTTYTVQGPDQTRGPEWDGWAVIAERRR